MKKCLGMMQYFEVIKKYDPFNILGMDKATDRIIKAVNNRERIIIYGYNDLDCITGISLLLLVLKYLNADVEYIIPDRVIDNRNLSSEIIKNHIYFLDASLIITVGCGINSSEEVELCKKLGIDIIISDYNLCLSTLPNTIIVDTNQKNCPYECKNLSSSGTAFKIIQAIASYYKMKCMKFVDLAAIGTISQLNEISGENRIIVEQGIAHINKTDNYGIKALLKLHKISEVTLENVSLLFLNLKLFLDENARINNSKIAVELFTTSNYDRAKQIAKYLNKDNQYQIHNIIS